MEVGGFKRVVVLDEDSQLDVNSKIVNSVNANFDRLYKAMNSGIDFATNINCGIISIAVEHGQEQALSHNLTTAPQNIVVMSGLAKVIMVSSSLRTLKIRSYLPQTFLTKDITGNTLTVTDPYNFAIGDTLVLQRTGNYDPIEVVIDAVDFKNRNIKIKSSVQASTYDIIYKKSETIKLLIF